MLCQGIVVSHIIVLGGMCFRVQPVKVLQSLLESRVMLARTASIARRLRAALCT